MVSLHGWRDCRIRLQPRDGCKATQAQIDELNQYAALIWCRMTEADRRAWHQFFCWGRDGDANRQLVGRVAAMIRERRDGRPRSQAGS